MNATAGNKDLVRRFVDAGNERDMDALTWDNLDILVQLGHIEPPPPDS